MLCAIVLHRRRRLERRVGPIMLFMIVLFTLFMGAMHLRQFRNIFVLLFMGARRYTDFVCALRFIRRSSADLCSMYSHIRCVYFDLFLLRTAAQRLCLPSSPVVIANVPFQFVC